MEHTTTRLQIESLGLDWVVVKELKLHYHNSKTILFTIYIGFGGHSN